MALRGESVPVSGPWHHVMALLTAAMLMAFCWSFLRLPEGNLLMVAFCFLSASSLYAVTDGRKRFALLLPMAFCAASLQFLIGICREDKLLLILLPALAAAMILRFLPGKASACSMCIAGYLAFFAPGGWLPAFDRACGIMIGIPVVLFATWIFHSYLPEKNGFYDSFGTRDSFLLAFLLGIGTWLAEALQLGQGPWIMLTVLFICQFSSASGRYGDASLDRTLAVPVGLLLGGLYLGCLAFFNYRFIYLLVPFGALSFYLLNRTGGFFWFTVFFMMAFSVYADWATGDLHRFHFMTMFSERSAATLIGSVFMILYDKLLKGEGSA